MIDRELNLVKERLAARTLKIKLLCRYLQTWITEFCWSLELKQFSEECG